MYNTVVHMSGYNRLQMLSSSLYVGRIVMKTHYVVFEYCSGTDLFSFLVTGPFERRKR